MSKTYAFISTVLDNENSIVALKAKGLKSNANIFELNQIGQVISKLEFGDTIITVSVDRFKSVAKLVEVFYYLKTKGVTFKSINEPYLDFRDGKELKKAVWEHIYKLAQDEQFMINTICNTQSILNNQKFLCTHICQLSIRVVQRTYSSEGILKRRA